MGIFYSVKLTFLEGERKGLNTLQEILNQKLKEQEEETLRERRN